MECRLCGKDRTLRNSHIIPEFLYEPLYDEKHRALAIRKDSPRFPLVQKGLREPMLCDECEGHFSRLERYFRSLWYGPPRILPDPVPEDYVVLRGLDYLQFKLFHLSILWRASVAQREEFQRVSLGPHERLLREMLLALEPGGPDEYSIFGSVLFEPDSRAPCHSLIISPVRRRTLGHTHYLFSFGGCAWHYMVSRHARLQTDLICLRADGLLPLVPINMLDFSPARDFFVERRRHLENKGERGT